MITSLTLNLGLMSGLLNLAKSLLGVPDGLAEGVRGVRHDPQVDSIPGDAHRPADGYGAICGPAERGLKGGSGFPLGPRRTPALNQGPLLGRKLAPMALSGTGGAPLTSASGAAPGAMEWSKNPLQILIAALAEKQCLFEDEEMKAWGKAPASEEKTIAAAIEDCERRRREEAAALDLRPFASSFTRGDPAHPGNDGRFGYELTPEGVAETVREITSRFGGGWAPLSVHDIALLKEQKPGLAGRQIQKFFDHIKEKAQTTPKEALQLFASQSVMP